MKEIQEKDILKTQGTVRKPANGSWEVALFCPVKVGEVLRFREEEYRVRAVTAGELHGVWIYHARLVAQPLENPF